MGQNNLIYFPWKCAEIHMAQLSCLSSRLVLLLQSLILFWFPQFLSSVLEITTLQIYVFWILLSFHSQDNFTKSYFPRTVMPWGSLPHSIKYATSSQQFKNFLHAHYETRLSVYRPPQLHLQHHTLIAHILFPFIYFFFVRFQLQGKRRLFRR